MKYLKYFEHRKSTPRSYNINKIIDAYVECALFTEEDNDDGALEDLTIHDIDKKSKEEIRKELEWFIDKIGGIINQMSEEDLGYDLWYTRNHHGVGFFDKNYPKHDEELLNKLSEVLGDAYIFNNNGKIEHESYGQERYKNWNFDEYMKELEFKKDVRKYNL